MGANNSELRVPVKLELLESSVELLKQTLSTLKVNSAPWKELNKLILGMEKLARDLGIAFSKPFGSQAAFTSAEKGLNKIDEALEKAKTIASSIKFSDILLTPAQSSALKEATEDLENLKKLVTNFKTQVKNELKASDLWEGIQKVDSSALAHSFDEIVKTVLKKVGQYKNEMNNAKAELEAFLLKATKAETTKRMFSAKDGPLSVEALGKDVFELFFKTNGTFKSGQLQEFYKWMEENLTLTPAQLETLKEKNSSALKEAFKDFDIKKIVDSANNTLNLKDTLGNKADISTAKFENALRVMLALSQEVVAVQLKEESLSDSTEKATLKILAIKQASLEAAQAHVRDRTEKTQLSNATDLLRDALSKANAEWVKNLRVTSSFSAMKMAVVNFMGFNQVLNITRRAVKNALNHIKELDSVMNKISIVTDMSTGDLWNQVDAYSKMAQTYGVSIKGAYEVSQIYYQQGLKTNDVLTLTNETLKLSKISGLDYAATTDYMTTALRGFKMEMSDASKVVDVYSALSAHTAVSSEELAVAMSKTASSLQSVGTTFEEASAMIGTMVAVTRESATNIGSALKSIAARYGEMTKDPMTLIDEEGETLAFNKVDAALQSVGISMKTTDGQFREFTDVIVELGEKWNSLESTQQRYIATLFAGNRQQSRFLALVSNVDLLKSNLQTAENSEDTGTIQALKALDSVESKLEQVKVAYQLFYTTIGAETAWKGALDGLRNYIDYLNGLPKLFGKLPVGAIAMVSNVIGLIRLLGELAISSIAKIWNRTIQEQLAKSNPVGELADKAREQTSEWSRIGEEHGKSYAEGLQKGAAAAGASTTKLIAEATKNATAVGASTGTLVANGLTPTTAQTVADTATLKATESPYSILDTAALKQLIESLNISETIQEQLSGYTIDTSTPINLLLNMFETIFHLVSDSSGQLKSLFESASNDAIAGYIQGLMETSGVADAASKVGQLSIDALRTAIRAHSPSDATDETGQDYTEGFKNGIVNKIAEATKAGLQLGKETVEALKTELLKETLSTINTINELKLKEMSRIQGLYGEDGLTAGLRAAFDDRRAELATKRAEILEKISSLRLTDAEKEDRDKLEFLIGELNSKKLSHDLIIGMGEGKLPREITGDIAEKYRSLQEDIIRIEAARDAAVTEAEKPLKDAKEELIKLTFENNQLWKRINDTNTKKKEKKKLMEEDAPALSARRKELDAKVKALEASTPIARALAAAPFNDELNVAKGRFLGRGLAFGREYNNSIEDLIYELQDKVDAYNRRETEVTLLKAEAKTYNEDVLNKEINDTRKSNEQEREAAIDRMTAGYDKLIEAVKLLSEETSKLLVVTLLAEEKKADAVEKTTEKITKLKNKTTEVEQVAPKISNKFTGENANDALNKESINSIKAYKNNTWLMNSAASKALLDDKSGSTFGLSEIEYNRFVNSLNARSLVKLKAIDDQLIANPNLTRLLAELAISGENFILSEEALALKAKIEAINGTTEATKALTAAILKDTAEQVKATEEKQLVKRESTKETKKQTKTELKSKGKSKEERAEEKTKEEKKINKKDQGTKEPVVELPKVQEKVEETKVTEIREEAQAREVNAEAANKEASAVEKSNAAKQELPLMTLEELNAAIATAEEQRDKFLARRDNYGRAISQAEVKSVSDEGLNTKTYLGRVNKPSEEATGTYSMSPEVYEKYLKDKENYDKNNAKYEEFYAKALELRTLRELLYPDYTTKKSLTSTKVTLPPTPNMLGPKKPAVTLKATEELQLKETPKTETATVEELTKVVQENTEAVKQNNEVKKETPSADISVKTDTADRKENTEAIKELTKAAKENKKNKKDTKTETTDKATTIETTTKKTKTPRKSKNKTEEKPKEQQLVLAENLTKVEETTVATEQDTAARKENVEVIQEQQAAIEQANTATVENVETVSEEATAAEAAALAEQQKAAAILAAAQLILLSITSQDPLRAVMKKGLTPDKVYESKETNVENLQQTGEASYIDGLIMKYEELIELKSRNGKLTEEETLIMNDYLSDLGLDKNTRNRQLERELGNLKNGQVPYRLTDEWIESMSEKERLEYHYDKLKGAGSAAELRSLFSGDTAEYAYMLQMRAALGQLTTLKPTESPADAWAPSQAAIERSLAMADTVNAAAEALKKAAEEAAAALEAQRSEVEKLEEAYNKLHGEGAAQAAKKNFEGPEGLYAYEQFLKGALGKSTFNTPSERLEAIAYRNAHWKPSLKALNESLQNADKINALAKAEQDAKAAEELAKALAEALALAESKQAELEAALAAEEAAKLAIAARETLINKIEEYIQKLIEAKVMTEELALAIRDGYDSSSLDQLIAKQELLKKKLEETNNKTKSSKTWMNALGMGISTLSTTIAGFVDQTSGASGAISSLGSIAGGVLRMLSGGPMAMVMGGITALTGLISFIDNFSIDKRLERATKKAEELENKAKEAKANFNTINNGIKLVDELAKKRHESAEAAEEYQLAVNDLAEKVPALVVGFDEAGNAIVDTTDAETLLALARAEAAKATLEATRAEIEKTRTQREKLVKEIRDKLTEADIAAEEATNGEYTTEDQAKTERIEAIKSELESLRTNSTDTSEINGLFVALTDMNSANAESYERNVDLVKKLLGSYGIDLTLGKYSTLNNLLNSKLEVPEEPLSSADYVDKILGNLRAISQLEDLTSDEADALIEETAKLFLLKQLFIDGITDKDSFEALQTTFNELNSKIGSLKGTENLLKALARTLITSWQNALLNTNQVWSYLEESSGAAAIVTNTAWKAFDAESATTEGGLALTDENIRIFMDDRTHAREYMETFWSNLNDEEKELFNKMIGDTANYSADDFTEVFKGIEGFENIQQMIVDYYAVGIKSIRERLEKNIELKTKDQDGKDKYEASVIKQFNDMAQLATTTLDEKLLNNLLSGYTSLMDNGYTSDAAAYYNAAVSLWTDMLGLPVEALNSVYSLMERYGIQTKGDIETIIKLIDKDDNPDNDKIIASLETLKNTLHENISLAIQTIVSNFSDNWKTEQSNISKLSSGVELSEIENILKSDAGIASGLTLDDFVTSGDKLILKQEKLDNYLDNWLKVQKGKFDEYSGLLDAIIENKDNITAEGHIFEEPEIELLKSIMGEDVVKNYMTDGKGKVLNYIVKRDEFLLAFDRSIKTTSDAVDYGQMYFKTAEEMLEKTRQWDKGNYKSLKDTLSTTEETYVAALLRLSKEGSDLTLYDDIAPDVRAAVEKIRGAYSSLISDVLSKGLDKINLSDYKGLTGISTAVLQTYIDKNDLAGFVARYAAYAGKTIDETNDLILQAIEKQTEKTDKDVIKDIQFLDKDHVKVSLEQLNNLAKIFDVPLQNLLSMFNSAVKDAEGNAVLSITKLFDSGIDLLNVDNYRDTLQKSVDDYLKSIVNAIKSALSGSLGIDDRNSLKSFAANYGMELTDDMFIRTAEGYQLTTNYATLLYNIVNDLDSLQGRVLFEELKNNVIETDERFASISSSADNIADLEEKVNSIANAGYQTKAGNVDLVAHASHIISGDEMNAAGWKDFTSEDWATLYSSTYTGNLFASDRNILVNVTPITNDGKTILSPEDLTKYVEDLLNKSSNAKEVELNDTLGLVMGATDVNVHNTKELGKALGEAELSMVALHDESAELAGEIANWDLPSDARIKQYEQELELVKLISRERSTSEDSSFSFMNNKIPGAQNNPLNYLGDWSKAFKTMNEAGKNKNMMDYTDFYNIVTEMGNIAKASGGIKLSATETLNNMDDAAALIEKGAAALSIAADGSIKVDLSKIGIDFSTGAGDLKTNVGKGIKSIASSQVKMLDSMIQLLETIVAMEDLGDLADEGPGDKNTIEITDILPEIKFDEKGNATVIGEYSEAYTKWINSIKDQIWGDAKTNEHFNQDLKDAMANIKIGDISFEDILGFSPQQLAAKGLNFLNQYSGVLDAFWKAAQSGNYDLNNIFLSVRDVLALSGFDGEVQIGDMKIVGKYGAVFTIDKEGHAIASDGTEFDDEKKCIQYELATRLDAILGIELEFNEDTGVLEIKDSTSIVTSVAYNVDNLGYVISFDDGTTASAATPEEANLAIATYAKMIGKEINGNIPDNLNDVLKFTIHLEGMMDLVFTIKDGKTTVTLTGQGVLYTDGDIENAKAQASATAEEFKKKVEEENKSNPVIIDGVDIKVAEGGTATLDLNGVKIVPTLPEGGIELTEAPLLKYTGTEPLKVEVPDLSATGSGTLDLGDCTLQLTENGSAKVMKGETAIAEIPVGDLVGTGALSSCTFEYNPTADNVTVLANGQAIGTIPIPDTLKGTGDLSKCTFTYNPTSNNLTVTKSDGTVVSEIPLDTLTGTGEIGNCTLTYNPADGNYTINGGAVLQPFTIESSLLSAKGVLTSENCTITLNKEGLHISTTDEEGETSSIEIPLPDLTGVGELSEENCTVTFNPSGELLITTAEGKIYTVTIPEELLAGVAKLLQADVEWLNGENFNTDAVKPLTEFDLGSGKAIYTITEVEVKSSENPYDAIRKNLYDNRRNTKNDIGTLAMEELGLSMTDDNKWFTVNIDTNTNSAPIIEYAKYLKEIVDSGKALGEIDLNNVQMLNSLHWDTNETNTASLKVLLDEIFKSLEWNVTNITDTASQLKAMTEVDYSGLAALSTALINILTAAQNLSAFDWAGLAAKMSILSTSNTPTTQEAPEIKTGSTTTVVMLVEGDTSSLDKTVEQANTEIESLTPTESIEGEDHATDVGLEAKNTIDAMVASITITASDSAESVINSIHSALNSLVSGGPYNVTVNAKVTKSGDKESEATGNFGLAKAQGTLMGELGPELVVSNGRYFVAGLGGPEFVDLAEDAIVFNHLQTEQLLKHGMSNTRGKAVTSEQNAVAFAKGSLQGGPAAASARAALKALKQLRAQWKAIEGMSPSDLAGLGGSGGGGGGGGGDKDKGVESAWIKAVERWYNLMQEIAKLEKEITHEEQLRTKLQSDWLKNGAAYYLSLKKSLLNIEKLMIAQEQLNIEQRDYYNQRVKLLSETPFGKLYGFNEGQLEYKLGTLSFLSDLMARDDYGATKYNAEEQYNLLVAKGFGDYMKYDSSGKAIVKEVTEGTASGSKGVSDESNFYASSVLAFWDLVESQKTEMLNLYDTVAEGENKMLELGNQRNEILKEIRDNLMELESLVLEAIVNQRQQAIDELEDQRKALEESTNKYIQGLTDALNKEKEMYLNELDEAELTRMRRQLAILQRSGAGASQINALLDLIRLKEQDKYFDYLQQLIDKIQEASDLELERLDTLISIMSEALEYEKEHGLLWNQVYDYLYNFSAAEIADFIMQNDTEMWGASPLRYEDTFQLALFQALQWEAFRNDLNNAYDRQYNKTPDGLTIADAVYGAPGNSDWKIFSTAMTNLYGDRWSSIADSMKDQFLYNYSKTGDITAATNSLTTSLNSLGTLLTSAVGGAFNLLKAEVATAKAEAEAAKASGGGGSGSGNGGKNTGSDNTPTTKKYDNIVDYAKAHTSAALISSLKSAAASLGSIANDLDAITGAAPTVQHAKIHYDVGGMVKDEGPAYLHAKEAVLTAQLASVLRNDILGNKPTSLMNLLLDFKDAYEGIGSNYSTTNNDSGIIIENATVEMHIDQISNDYDARRAGEQALSEMMRIARRTSASNSIGR